MLLVWLAAGLGSLANGAGRDVGRPNILWISLEDLSPDLGCYGAVDVKTPHIDGLARDGVRFDRAFSTAGVCAPSRSAIITGAHQMTLGTQHMRSNMPKPSGIKTLPEVMRDHGYYCANNSKQDYNFNGDGMWDDSTAKAHWRNRARDQPFFSVFNLTGTHEGRTWVLDAGVEGLRQRNLEQNIRAPEDVKVPGYYVDAPIIRRHLANYYNLISLADVQVGEILQALKDDGLEDDTIVFLWGDHGRGLPRSKFWLYTMSTRVPLLVRVPEKWRRLLPARPGTVDADLRSLLDLYPSTLTAAGIPVPGHAAGRSLFEPGQADRVLLAGRDRLGYRQDLSRAVRTKEWLYIRNYIHDGAYVARSASGWYLSRSPIQAEMWKHDGSLTPAQDFFSQRARPAEELYALDRDPEETNNLAERPEFAAVRARMRAALERKLEEIRDSGFTPEFELYQTLTAMAARGQSVFDPGFQGWPARPEWLNTPSAGRAERERLLGELTSERTERRYWALRELINQQSLLEPREWPRLAPLLQDPSVDVRLQAIRLFASLGRYDQIAGPLKADLGHSYGWARTVALGIVDELPLGTARRFVDEIRNAPEGGYVGMIRPYLLEKLGQTVPGKKKK